MKKKLFLTALLAAALIAFSSCGQPSESSEDSSSETQQSSSQADSTDEDYSSVVSSLLEEEGEVTNLLLATLPEGGETHVYSGSSLLKGEIFELEPDLDGDSLKEFFRVSRDQPNGVKVLASYEQRGQNLAGLFTIQDAFDQVGDLREDWYLQLSFWDLDQNGQPDVLLSVGDGKKQMETVVVLFDAHSSEHFSYLGSISGTSGLTVDSSGYMTDADGAQYTVKERELYKVSGENYEKVHVVVTDDALAEQIKTLIEPLAITCPEDFSRPDQLSSDTLLNTVLFSYILHSNPEEREYTDAHVCIPEKDADRQCQLLFGDAVSLNPMNYVQSSGQERIFYDAEEECYKMPSAGYYYDLPRVDKVEETEDGYLATVSFVAYTPGEEPEGGLEDLPATRTVIYDLVKDQNSLIVRGLENQ